MIQEPGRKPESSTALPAAAGPTPRDGSPCLFSGFFVTGLTMEQPPGGRLGNEGSGVAGPSFMSLRIRAQDDGQLQVFQAGGIHRDDPDQFGFPDPAGEAVPREGHLRQRLGSVWKMYGARHVALVSPEEVDPLVSGPHDNQWTFQGKTFRREERGFFDAVVRLPTFDCPRSDTAEIRKVHWLHGSFLSRRGRDCRC